MELHLRFGVHRDKPLIHEVKHLLDGLVMPAHILAYQPPSSAVFVTSLPAKDYIIDPMTFIFQNPTGTHLNAAGQLRPSVQKLCEAYHENLARDVTELSPTSILQPGQYPDLSQFCANIVSFQLKKVSEESRTSEAEKYLQRYTRSRPTEPRFVVPPYFHFSDVGDQWYDFSLEAAAKTTEVLSDDIPIAPVILCDVASIVSSAARKRIARDYRGYSAVLLWVNSFRQTEAGAAAIRAVRGLIEALAGAGLSVQMLYGGYLMALCAADGLEGISHGILYTEHKSMTLTPGSGGAPERYYVPAFHEFRSLSQTDLIVHQFPELMCNCDVCERVLKGRPDNIVRFGDEPELLRKHFLTVRRRELEHIESKELDVQLEELRNTYREYNGVINKLPNPDAFVRPSPMRGLEYLANWASAFEDS